MTLFTLRISSDASSAGASTPPLVGARNRALVDLVTEVPPPLVADALGYSHQIVLKHAQAAAEPWARYAGQRANDPRAWVAPG